MIKRIAALFVLVILARAQNNSTNSHIFTVIPNAPSTIVGWVQWRDLQNPAFVGGFKAPNTWGTNNLIWRLMPNDAAGCIMSDGSLNLSINACLASAGVNVQTGSSYTFLNSDCGKLVVFNSSVAVAVTLPQAGAGGSFASSCLIATSNINTGTVTITPTTSTIDGAATALLYGGVQGFDIYSNGSNYYTNRGQFRVDPAPVAGDIMVFDPAGTKYAKDTGLVPPSSSSFGAGSLFEEVPSGTIDGSNTIFNLTYKPCPPILIPLDLDGVVQEPAGSAGADFTVDVNGKITYTVAPKVGDVMWARYFRCALAGSGGGGGGSLGARMFLGSLRWTAISNTNITGDLSIGMWLSIPSDGFGIVMSRGNIHWPFMLMIGSVSPPSPGVNNSNEHTGTLNYCHTYGSGAGADCMYWNDAIPVSTVNHFARPTTDTWSYVGLTRDNTAKTITLYVGNATSLTLVSTQSYAHNPDLTSDSFSNGIWLGDLQGGCAGCEGYVDIQEHYIWSGKLTQAQHLLAAQGNAIALNLQLKCLMGNNPEVDLSPNANSSSFGGTPPLVNGH